MTSKRYYIEPPRCKKPKQIDPQWEKCAELAWKYHLDCKRSERKVRCSGAGASYKEVLKILNQIEKCIEGRTKYARDCMHPECRDVGHEIYIAGQAGRRGKFRKCLAKIPGTEDQKLEWKEELKLEHGEREREKPKKRMGSRLFKVKRRKEIEKLAGKRVKTIQTIKTKYIQPGMIMEYVARLA